MPFSLWSGVTWKRRTWTRSTGSRPQADSTWGLGPQTTDHGLRSSLDLAMFRFWQHQPVAPIKFKLEVLDLGYVFFSGLCFSCTCAVSRVLFFVHMQCAYILLYTTDINYYYVYTWVTSDNILVSSILHRLTSRTYNGSRFHLVHQRTS